MITNRLVVVSAFIVRAAILVFLIIGSAVADEAAIAEPTRFDIEEQPLKAALTEFARQSDREILFATSVVADKQGPTIAGTFEPEEALGLLLADTGLDYSVTGSDTFLVNDKGGDSDPKNSTPQPILMAQDQAPPQKALEQQNKNYADEELPLEEIIVTGTHIKGVKDQFAPVMQVSRDEMDLAGFVSVADVMESIPQNFGGGVTADTSIAGPGTGPGGAGVNLRGLGNQATLILLNGRRLAAGGSAAQFVDISAIPTSAIERVEVLADGASAIYGSDAIAGVVNIILRDDFDGAETRLNAGATTDGGGQFLRASQTIGWSGDKAHAMVTYEYSDEGELDSDERDFSSSAIEPTWLLPSTQKHSVFASTGVQLSESLELRADGYLNDRKSEQYSSRDTTSFVQEYSEVNVEQYGTEVGFDLALSNDWEANLSGSYSSSDQTNEALRISAGSNEFFSTETEVMSIDGTLGGPLISITTEPIRGVVGAHYRTEDMALLRDTSLGGVLNDVERDRSVFAAFGEVYAPIVAEGEGLPGIHTLAVSAAVRYEDYSDVGSSVDPKIGLAWSPVTGVNIRGTYGTSFRAPRLDQLVDNVASASLSGYIDPTGNETVALLVRGSTDELDPETATTWTAGVDFSPIEGLVLRGTYFNIEFEDQVGIPSVGIDSNINFVDFTGIPTTITPDVARDICDRAVICFNFADFFPQFAGLTFDDVEVLLDGRQINLASSKVEGFDIEGSYDFSNELGDWRIFVGGTYLTTFEQQVAPATPVDNLLNTFANPVDIKARGGARLRRDNYSAAVSVNYVGDYADDEVPSGDFAIGSFTTIDLSFRLYLDGLVSHSFFGGTSIDLSVLNVLNEDPPQIGPVPLRSNTFDPANSNPRGRSIGLLLTKQW